MVEDLTDTIRVEPGFTLGERDMLEAWLEFHRRTLFLKCDGLSDTQRQARPVPTSKLSLHGLVRHMAEVELGWFQRVLGNDPQAPYHWTDEGREDSELEPLDDAVWDEDLATWRAQCDESRRVAGGLSLDDTGTHRQGPCSLRWVYAHMIEEYARHNGHADLLRELVGGSVGW